MKPPKALRAIALGLRLFPHRDRETRPTEPSRTVPRRTGPKQAITCDPRRVRDMIRTIERLRDERDQCLSRAKINADRAQAAMDADAKAQVDLRELVGRDCVINVGGVLYEISTDGVLVSGSSLIE